MKLRAYAKINLGLDVLRRREDGYHEVRMIMQTIRMYDRLEIKKTSEPGIHLRTNLDYIPVNEDNLVYKAAKLLMDKYEIREGITIDLRKFIPVAAGMAGGSSDAAATLVGVNKIFDLGLSMEELMELGVKIGADVPYCVMRGTALAEGIGEKLTPLPPVPECYVLIGKPGISVSTKYVYTNLKLDENTRHPDIDGMLEAINRGELSGMAERMKNVLEPGVAADHPVITEIEELMKAHGALQAIMSGSGPTVFGLFDDKSKAEKALEALKESRLARNTFLTTVFNNGGTGNDK